MSSSMGWRDRWQAALKAFRLGPAVVMPYESELGIPSSAPDSYAEYIAQSVGVYACINLRAKLLSSLPLKLYKVDQNGDRAEVTKGPLFDLLQKVNPSWTFPHLLKMTEYALGTSGQAFLVMERGENGARTPQELWWANPTKMRVLPDPQNYIKGFIYEERGRQIRFDRTEVIWIRYPNPVNEFQGLSPIAAARLSIDLGIDGLRSNAQLFRQGMHLGGIITPDGNSTLSSENAKLLDESMKRRFMGIGKFHKWLIVGGANLKVTPMGISPKDAEFIGQMKWSLADICRVYNVPPVLVQDLEKATYSNYEQAMKAIWSLTIIPQARMIASELQEQLLPLFPNDADVIEFDVSGIAELQEAEDSKWLREQGQLSLGAITVNEWRATRGLDPVAWGDEPYSPGGLTAMPTNENTDAEPAKSIKSYRKAFEYGGAEHSAVMKRFDKRVKRHAVLMKMMLSKIFEEMEADILQSLDSQKSIHRKDPIEPFDREKWVAELRRRSTPLLRDAVEDAGEATLSELHVSISFNLADPRVSTAFDRQVQTFSAQVMDYTYRRLTDSLSAGVLAGEGFAELQERVTNIMGIARESRAEAIARTETIRATNTGAIEGARQSGVVKQKKWLSAIDNMTRDAHIDAHGETVGIDEPFIQTGEALDYPGDGSGSAGNTINCRCTMAWVVDSESEGERTLSSELLTKLAHYASPNGAKG